MNERLDDFASLEKRVGQAWEIAQEFGLDPFPTHFEIVPPDIMHEMGTYGIPGHYSHWTHGRAFRQTKTMHDYGFAKVYEMVINANPSLAFLLENNTVPQNTLIAAHVLGHTDFFKHNGWFAPTRRDMSHAAAISAERIRAYEFKEGKLLIEQFLDAALSIAEHIDPQNPNRPSRKEQEDTWQEEFKKRQTKRDPETEFDDIIDFGKVKEKPPSSQMPIPLDPDRDLLGFIRDFSTGLHDWQRDILDIVRAESFYFRPQMQTKIMNEGWATFWHKRIMREMGDRKWITEAENWDWVRMHAGVVQTSTGGLNPYFFGMHMFEWIADYHNGQIDDEQKRWLDKERLPVYSPYEGRFVGSPGHRKIFEIRELDNDQGFIRNHFVSPVSNRMHLFLYKAESRAGQTEYIVDDKDWKTIRDNLVAEMNNCGIPVLNVVDGNFGNKGELFIRHTFEDREIYIPYLERTLPYLYKLWGKPVHLETVVEGKKTTYTFAGEKTRAVTS